MSQRLPKSSKSPSGKRDSIEDIVRYYEKNQEDKRFETQQLEYLVTRSLLDHYIEPNSSILELGAGTGRYTLELAGLGHVVTAIELVPKLASLIEERLRMAGISERSRAIAGDAREVTSLVKESFDVTLAMGPLYHLNHQVERDELMTGIRARTRPGGTVITTHLTRLGVISYMLARYPAWALQSPQQIEQLLTTGYILDHPRNGDFRGYFSTLVEMEELHEKAGLSVQAMHCQDPLIGSVDEIFSNLPEELKLAWLDTLIRVSSDPAALGSGRSILVVSRRE